MQYPVEMDGKRVGTVCITRLGLYVEIKCVCSYQKRGFQRLHMVFDDKELDLGILVSEGDAYVIKKKIPSKQLGSGDVRFRVSTAIDKGRDLIELLPNQPISCLHKVAKSMLFLKGDHRFLCIQSAIIDDSVSSQ